MSIHPAAARGYRAGGDDYERARPDYPAAAMDLVVAQLGLAAGRSVVDLGAGTGKLTRLLRDSNADVVAVEPVPAMVEHLSTVAGVWAVTGAAEALPLAAQSVDAVTAGTAFHWFKAGEALVEIHRVLRAEGGLALLWNNPDRGTPWVAQVWAMIDAHRRDTPGNRDLRWKDSFQNTPLFTALEHRRFTHHQQLEIDELITRVTSISFIASLPAPEQDLMLTGVRQVLATDPETSGKRRLTLPYQTDVYWCRKRQTRRPS